MLQSAQHIFKPEISNLKGKVLTRCTDVNIDYFCFMKDITFKTYHKFIAERNFFPLFFKFTFNWRMIAAMWCQFLPYTKVNEPSVHTLLSLSTPPHPTLWLITKPRAEPRCAVQQLPSSNPLCRWWFKYVSAKL